MTTLSSRLPFTSRRVLALLALALLPACAHARSETATTPACACTPPQGEACGGPSGPHGPPGPPPNPEEWIAARVAELTQALSLDAAQQAEVRSALDDARVRMDALRQQPGAPSEDGNPPDPAWREQARQIRDQADDRIWAVLRCDQKDRMHAYEREQRQRFLAEHGGRYGHGHHGCGCQHPHGPPPSP